MLGTTKIERIKSNPSFGLIPIFVFSFLVCFVNSRIATGVALILSVVGLAITQKRSRLIYDASTITFLLAFILSFTTLSGLPFLNKFIIVEVIFVVVLIFIRISKGRLLTIVARERDNTSKNILRDSFKIAFQTQYGLMLHLLLALLYFVTGNDGGSSSAIILMIGLAQLVIVGIMVLETVRLHILYKKLCSEEWLPVVTETGQVTGRVAKSVTKDYKNRFMHPVVRVALMHNGSIYLREREQTRVLNPGRLDYPFEKYMQFNDEIDNTVKKTIGKECGNENLPLRFMLKYIFENDITKRLIFLYVSEINDEKMFNGLNLFGGKLWSIAQIEDNIDTGVFSECFELEFEYLKNTLLLAQQFKKTL